MMNEFTAKITRSEVPIPTVIFSVLYILKTR